MASVVRPCHVVLSDIRRRLGREFNLQQPDMESCRSVLGKNMNLPDPPLHDHLPISEARRNGSHGRPVLRKRAAVNYSEVDDSELDVGQLIQCEICMKPFISASALSRHKLATHGHDNAENGFRCSKCNTYFTRRTGLRRHLRTVVCYSRPVDESTTYANPSPPVTLDTGKQQNAEILSDSTSIPSTAESNNTEDASDLQCKLCYKMFILSWDLEHHLQTAHSTEKPYQCSKCKTCFSRRHGLQRHLKNTNIACTEQQEVKQPDTSRVRKCICSCGRYFKRSDRYRRHIAKCLYYSNQCKVCQVTFISMADLDEHTKTHHPRQLLHNCDECKVTYNTAMALAAHVISRHSPMNCKHCQESLPNFRLLKRHVHNNHPEIDSSTVLVSCCYCDRQFSYAKLLANHMRSMHGELAHRCRHCHKEYRLLRHLKEHMSRVHQISTAKYACATCGSKFTTQYFLSCHMKRHTEEAIYKCMVCGNSYYESRDLKNHMLSHLRSKDPKLCDICGKEFNGRCRLRRHVDAVHKGTRDFVCLVCSKSFQNSDALRGHMAIHTGAKDFLCEVCGTAFARSAGLYLHMRIHTGVRPHTCSWCGRTFVTTTHLQNHERIHTGARPFVCDICGKDFITIGNKINHMKTHTDRQENGTSEEVGKTQTRENQVGTTDARANKSNMDVKRVNNDNVDVERIEMENGNVEKIGVENMDAERVEVEDTSATESG